LICYEDGSVSVQLMSLLSMEASNLSTVISFRDNR
jgi:hypothetical protein